MAKSLFQASGIATALGVTATNHAYIQGSNSVNTTETNRQVPIRTAGVFSNLRVYVNANTLTSTTTIRTRKNTANGAQSVAVGSSASGSFTDATNTDTVAAGDTVNYQIVTGNTGTTITITNLSLVFNPTTTTTTITRYGNIAPANLTTASQTRFYSLNHDVETVQTTESNCQTKFRKAGTLKHLAIRVSANARTTATTVRTRKNTANGAQSVSIGSTATGVFEDTANTDTIAANDLVCTSSVTGTGTQTLTIQIIAFSFESSNSDQMFVADQTTNVTNGATSHYLPINADLSSITNNNQYTAIVDFAGTLANLGMVLTSNTIAAVSTGYIEINGANSAVTVSIGSSATGTFEDTTNTATIAAGQKLTYKLVPGNSNNLTWRRCWCTLTTSAGTTPVSTTRTHKYNVIGKVSRSKTHKWNIQAVVVRSKTHKFNIFKIVSLNRTHKYSILQQIAQSKTHKWNIIGLITRLRTHKYSILQTLTVSKTHRYNILKYVSKVFTHLYNVIGKITQNKTHKYDIIAKITTLKTHKFNIFHQVTSSKTHKFSLLHKVTQSKTHKFSILATVTASKTHKWDIIGKIIANKTHKWNIQHKITQTKTHLFNILNKISQTKTHRYNIEAVGTVSTTKIHKYHIEGRISTTKTHKFSILKRVTQPTIHKFSIIATITASKTHKFNILEKITQSKTHICNTLAKITQNNTHKYNIQHKLTVSKTHKYDILHKVTPQSRYHLYNIIGRVTATKTHRYNNEGAAFRVEAQKSHRFSVIQKITATKIHLYNIVTAIAPPSSKTHKYNILQKVTTNKTHKYSITGKVTTTKTHKWHQGGIVLVTKTHRYDVGSGKLLRELGGSTNVYVKFPERVKILDIVSNINNLATANIEVVIPDPPSNLAIGVVVIAKYAVVSRDPILSASVIPEIVIQSGQVLPERIDSIQHIAVCDHIAIEILEPDPVQIQLLSEIRLQPSQQTRIQLISSTQLKEDEMTKIKIASATELALPPSPTESGEEDHYTMQSLANIRIPYNTGNQTIQIENIMPQDKAKRLKVLIDLLKNDALFENG